MQFEFLVMTEQSILVYKLVLSLNISDFSLFFVEKLQRRPPPALKKVTPLFPSNPPLKTSFPATCLFHPPPPPAKSGEGVVHTML